MPTHSGLADSELHNPKGFAGASNSTTLTKNSSGSLAWVTHFIDAIGEMKIQNNSTAFTPGAADITSFKHLANTGWVAGEYSNTVVSADDVNDNIATTNAGTYFVTFWCVISTAAATGVQFAFKYALDGTVDTNRKLLVQKNSSGADMITVSATGYVTTTAAQELSIYMASSATTTLTITDGGLTVQRVK